jgi:hypothetical protein
MPGHSMRPKPRLQGGTTTEGCGPSIDLKPYDVDPIQSGHWITANDHISGPSSHWPSTIAERERFTDSRSASDNGPHIVGRIPSALGCDPAPSGFGARGSHNRESTIESVECILEGLMGRSELRSGIHQEGGYLSDKLQPRIHSCEARRYQLRDPCRLRMRLGGSGRLEQWG